MIQTLYQIGNAIKDDPDYEDYFQPWGNPFPGRENESKVLVAELENGEFKNVVIENFRKEYLDKYLFRVGSTKGRATNAVPTVPFIKLNESFTKVEQSFKNFGHKFASPEVLKEVKGAVAALDLSKNQYLFTFRLNGKYLGEYPEYVEIFEDNAYRGFSEKNYSGLKVSSANNYVCSLSGKRAKVYGFVDSLGFTVNDDAYMRGGFNQGQSYKMFPVSQEAAKIIDGMKALVFNNEFTNHFAGKVKYLILPKIIASTEKGLIKEVFELFRNKQALNLYTGNDKKGTKGFINGADNLIIEIVEDEELNRKDVLYDILFFDDSNNSQLSLLLQLTDVRPSRLHQIIDNKRKTETFYAPLTNYDDGKKNHYVFNINLVRLKDFLVSEQGRKKVLHPYFYKIVEAIFYGQKLGIHTFISFLLLKFQKAFKELHANPYGLQKAAKEGFALLSFLGDLNIFHQNLKIISMEQKNQEVNLDVVGFMEQHQDFFRGDNNEEYGSHFKKGAFLFGLLVGRLSEVEGARLGSRPFLKRLNNGRITFQTIQNLYEPLVKKLEVVYDEHTNFYKVLKPIAANYLMGGHKTFTNDEISFAVMLGYSLYYDLKPNKTNNNGAED